MSSGKRMSWRLLSPFAVLLWVVATVAFAGTAHAETGTDPDAVQVAVDEPQAAAHAPAAPAPDEHAAEAAGAAVATHPSGSTTGSGSAGTSGDVTEPQPISNADANTGGANGQCPDGPYCSTRDGSPSDNGSGGGNATGEPCAGCVGKADNKNPHGQLPDASDSNAGYECDTNHGVAKGNPAHTGCQTAPPQECVPTPTVPCVPPPPACVPTPTVPCVPSPPVCVTGCVSPPLVSSGAPNPPASVSPPQQILPNTGAPAGLLGLTSAALAGIVVGAGLVRRGRRRTAQS